MAFTPRGRRRVPSTPYRARLECGCIVKLRLPPFGDHAKFTCANGQGHMGLQRWASCWRDDRPEYTRMNRLVEGEKRDEGEEGAEPGP